MSNKSIVHYPKPENCELQQKIVETVKDNAGGIKFLELMLRLAEDNKDFRKQYSFDFEKFCHDVEWYCRNTKSIKTLDYQTKDKVKMFIYTP